MRAGAVQLNATDDTDRNLATADRLVRDAAADGAELVVLPEKWSVLGTPEQIAAGGAAARRRVHHLGARDRARARHRAGRRLDRRARAGQREDVEHERARRPRRRAARGLPQDPHVRRRGRRRRLRASPTREQPGDEIVVSTLADGIGLGMSICYDLRFPELYRIARRARRAR